MRANVKQKQFLRAILGEKHVGGQMACCSLNRQHLSIPIPKTWSSGTVEDPVVGSQRKIGFAVNPAASGMEWWNNGMLEQWVQKDEIFFRYSS